MRSVVKMESPTGFYVTPANSSSAFLNVLKTPNFENIGNSYFRNRLFQIFSKFWVFKLNESVLDLIIGVT